MVAVACSPVVTATVVPSLVAATAHGGASGVIIGCAPGAIGKAVHPFGLSGDPAAAFVVETIEFPRQYDRLDVPMSKNRVLRTKMQMQYMRPSWASRNDPSKWLKGLHPKGSQCITVL